MGCTSCHIIPGYSCTGSLGSKSTCDLVSSTWRYTSIGAIAIIDKSFPDPVGWRWMTSAEGKSIASDIVSFAKGKKSPMYTPNVNPQYKIVVLNAEHVVFSGKKMDLKIYRKYTRYVGNDQEIIAKDLKKKDPTAILEKAIKGMMQRNHLCREIQDGIFVYAGSNHKHGAQIRHSVAVA